MQLFWSNDRPLPFSDVVRYCNEEKGHDWAQTTIHTYLTRLIEKGVLLSNRKGYKRSYYAAVSEAELSHQYATRFVEEAFDGSVKNLFASLTYHTKLSKEEIDELRQLLDSNDSDENRGGAV